MSDSEMSPVVGIIFMVAITVLLAAVIAAFVFGYQATYEECSRGYFDGYSAGFAEGRAQGILEGRTEALGNESVWHETCVNEGLKIIMKSVLPEFERDG